VPPRSTPENLAYCTQHGGVVQEREPFYGTNGGTPLQLAGKQDFCQWTSKKDGSQISVLMSTLTTRLPTLAALAYYAEVPYNGANCSRQPGFLLLLAAGRHGSVRRHQRGGRRLGADDRQHGRARHLHLPRSQSSIDTYGLFYHSDEHRPRQRPLESAALQESIRCNRVA
jgi:hypothetical protein